MQLHARSQAWLFAAGLLGVSLPAVASAQDAPVITPRLVTTTLHQYDGAPLTPDADDPAIWVNPRDAARSLIFGTLKDGGMQVYDLEGRVLQTIVPAHHAAVADDSPPVAGVTRPLDETAACPDSDSGETYGRFNGVAVHRGLKLRRRGRPRGDVVDVVVVTDRGCDRLRVYAIDPTAAAPLTEITDGAAPRVFPDRIVQPSFVQPMAELSAGLQANPVDDQNTAYGLALHAEGQHLQAFVTQRSRARVLQLELFDTGRGTVSYRRVRDYRFPASFTVLAPDGRGLFYWTPCREDAVDDPQFEGIAVDAEYGALYAAQEVVGVWKLPLSRALPAVVNVPQLSLIEPTTTFGAPYWAVPDDGEWSCESFAPLDQLDRLPAGTMVAAGSSRAAGRWLEPDVEGIAIHDDASGGQLVISSQGDSSFHLFERTGGFTRFSANEHLSTFFVDAVGDTDGLEIVSGELGPDFPHGLVVIQNGEAPPPDDDSDISGYEYDGSTRFELLAWEDIAEALGLPR